MFYIYICIYLNHLVYLKLTQHCNQLYFNKKKRKKKKKFNTVDFIPLWSTHLSETVQGYVKGVLLGHKGEKGTLDPAQAGRPSRRVTFSGLSSSALKRGQKPEHPDLSGLVSLCLPHRSARPHSQEPWPGTCLACASLGSSQTVW